MENNFRCGVFLKQKLHKTYGLGEENVLDRKNKFAHNLNAHIVETISFIILSFVKASYSELILNPFLGYKYLSYVMH